VLHETFTRQRIRETKLRPWQGSKGQKRQAGKGTQESNKESQLRAHVNLLWNCPKRHAWQPKIFFSFDMQRATRNLQPDRGNGRDKPEAGRDKGIVKRHMATQE
jgi:hypothetical protein